jgi:hypothetical protein
VRVKWRVKLGVNVNFIHMYENRIMKLLKIEEGKGKGGEGIRNNRGGR